MCNCTRSIVEKNEIDEDIKHCVCLCCNAEWVE
jgi:hypothetical protein